MCLDTVRTQAASPRWPPPLAHSLWGPGTQPQIAGNKTLCVHKSISLAKSPGSWWASPWENLSRWPPLDVMTTNGQSPPRVLKSEQMPPVCMGTAGFQHERGASRLALEGQPSRLPGCQGGSTIQGIEARSPEEGQWLCIFSLRAGFICKDGALYF